MGWLDYLFGGLISTGQQIYNNEFNKREAEKNRDFQSEEAETSRQFNAHEAALQRHWSSQEAERARDWNEEMYEKYNSLSGKIHQAEQAGVNPMFAITGNAVSPMSASSSAPSGASASGGAPSGSSATSSFVDIVGSILGMAKLKAEIKNIEADTKKKDAEGEGQLITNESLRDMNVQQILESKSRIQYNEENTKLVTSKILNTDADTEKKVAELAQIASSIANMDADTNVKVQQIANMLSEIEHNNASIDLLAMQSDKLSSEIKRLNQDFSHNEIMNAIYEISSSRDAGAGEHSNGYYRAISEVKRFIESVLGWFSGGASFSKVDK